MKKNIFIVIILLQSFYFYGQTYLFNVSDVTFEDFGYESTSPPRKLFFSDGENFLNAVYSYTTFFKLVRINCHTKAITESIHKFPNADEVLISPDQTKMLVRDIYNPSTGNYGFLYYFPNINDKDKFYKIDLGTASAYRWMNNDNIYFNYKVFNLTSWNYVNENSVREENTGNVANNPFRIFYGQSTRYGGGGNLFNGLWIESVNDEPNVNTHLNIFFDENKECENVKVSPGSSFVAYYLNKKVWVRRALIQPKTQKYFCLDFSQFNGEYWDRQLQLIRTRLSQQGFISATAFYPRTHPVTGEIIEGGVSRKAVMQIVGIKGNFFVLRFLKGINNEDEVNTNDFIKEINGYSFKTLGAIDLGVNQRLSMCQ